MAFADTFGRDVLSSPSTLVGVVFIVAVALGIGQTAGQWAVVIYALSFWHYLIYALAFVCRAIPLPVFERDAVLMKGVSLVAFAAVYLTVTPDLLSLLVVAIGLIFNLSAARALGTDRTYYGYELASLPPKLITSFPYSVLAHPMLTGNAVAFTGTLLNAEFRAEWWPLAVAHVVLNLAILVMEARAKPRSVTRPAPVKRHGWLVTWQAGAALACLGALFAGIAGGGWLFIAGIALAMLAFGTVLFETYAWGKAPAVRMREPTA